MARVFTYEDFTTGYVDLVNEVILCGEEVSPRGQRTQELRNVTIEILNPRKSAPLGVNRKLPTKIVATEAIQLLAGVSDLRQLDAASNGNFTRFSDDGVVLAGAYGPRTHKQLANVVRVLRDDPDSRQAGATIWHGHETNNPSKDVPCTLNLFFSIRNKKLEMSTYMRSNDVWLGSAIDFPVFCQIQAAVAWALGVELGSYTHTAVSLHIYEQDIKAALALTAPTSDEEIPFFVDGMLVPMAEDPVRRWSQLTDTALAVKSGMLDPLGREVGIQWFNDKLFSLDQYGYFDTDRYFRGGSND
jgi:thymidylate synthase